ncbi:MAG: hypothetical protein V4597_11750 [Pseudomonadota bacterium]
MQLLLDHLGAQLGPVRFRIWYEFSGQGIEFTLPGLADADRSSPRLATVQEPVPPLDEDDLAVLRVLAGSTEPLQGKHIASRLRVPRNGTLKGRLSRLRRLTLIDHVSGCGYTLTDRGRRALDPGRDQGRTNGPST